MGGGLEAETPRDERESSILRPVPCARAFAIVNMGCRPMTKLIAMVRPAQHPFSLSKTKPNRRARPREREHLRADSSRPLLERFRIQVLRVSGAHRIGVQSSANLGDYVCPTLGYGTNIATTEATAPSPVLAATYAGRHSTPPPSPPPTKTASVHTSTTCPSAILLAVTCVHSGSATANEAAAAASAATPTGTPAPAAAHRRSTAAGTTCAVAHTACQHPRNASPKVASYTMSTAVRYEKAANFISLATSFGP
ncbi:pentapeptide repeat-containing protein [Striga asiatica]|uniref:Pentapeptide repeat-containing protein n=1 Tax=Striga asiatica TaxID=4170 RepID=A0A5A7RJB9_STRAF|nr:pentapeptide repeat-containing protein [Striga asiatica]